MKSAKSQAASTEAKNPPRWNGPPTENVIVPAFECAGIQFFQHLDLSGMASGRAFQAIQFQEEYNMRVDKEHLVAHCKAMRDSLNAGQLVEAAHLTTVLEKRLEFILEPDLLYKMASVVFFDESESPFTYDFAYNERKIALWKGEKVEDFLYGTPMRSYLPSSAIFEGGLTDYIAAVRLYTAIELESYITILSRNPQNSATVEYLTSQAGTRREWLKSNGYRSMNTTSL